MQRRWQLFLWSNPHKSIHTHSSNLHHTLHQDSTVSELRAEFANRLSEVWKTPGYRHSSDFLAFLQREDMTPQVYLDGICGNAVVDSFQISFFAQLFHLKIKLYDTSLKGNDTFKMFPLPLSMNQPGITLTRDAQRTSIIISPLGGISKPKIPTDYAQKAELSHFEAVIWAHWEQYDWKLQYQRMASWFQA